MQTTYLQNYKVILRANRLLNVELWLRLHELVLRGVLNNIVIFFNLKTT